MNSTPNAKFLPHHLIIPSRIVSRQHSRYSVAILAGITAIMTELFRDFHYFLQAYAKSVPQLGHHNFFFEILSNSSLITCPVIQHYTECLRNKYINLRVSIRAQNCLYKQGSRNVLLMLQQEPDQNPSGTSHKPGACPPIGK
jgi:hypothetical protein